MPLPSFSLQEPLRVQHARIAFRSSTKATAHVGHARLFLKMKRKQPEKPEGKKGCRSCSRSAVSVSFFDRLLVCWMA